jgi:D-alanyl-D-alanine carboxypeptidase/D-alanyl-D-alanine-endopeptidase (penicillin-binding protein 4)
MTQPAETAALALKQSFESRGVRVGGTATVHHALPPEIYPDSNVVLGPAPEPTPLNTTVLAEHLSPTSLETARMTNKVSQNLHAELLLRAAARATKGFGVTEAGIWAEQDFLRNIGVADDDVLLEDGSGLSGGDLVTPRSLAQVLHFDAQQPWGEGYISTFPIAGVDGTLENRMKKTSAAGMVFAKTGSLEHVRALSGFATTVRGEHLVFSIFGNNNAQPGHDAQSVIDSIAIAMVETLGAPPPPVKKTKKK